MAQASGGSSSSDQSSRYCHGPDAAAERRRKRGGRIHKGKYSVRKEEIEDQTKEVRLLTTRLNRLRREQASRDHESEDEYAQEQDDEDEMSISRRAVQPPLDRDANLRRTVHSQQRMLWGAHALLLDWVVSPASFSVALWSH